ncbi:MAG: hypothetical protein QS748_08905 [Candidatus Endonucleobacter bathymodioli]|uniref:Uncharacterized protein n=1 Tax=Candidatus Endonucleibacter bathymodioli TaxID=539814 RepID=A0AA90SDG2_9GAMM|nr:hypothetical protein [Candidatus Endonucleobacter bathymodioli]
MNNLLLSKGMNIEVGACSGRSSCNNTERMHQGKRCCLKFICNVLLRKAGMKGRE